MNFQDFKCDKTPAELFYIPNFISESEETNLISQINNAPKPKWTQLSHRRLQNWGGLPHSKGMIAETLPAWLTAYMTKVAALGMFEDKLPNHVLINEYLPGQGIMPHTDGPLFHPVVTTINCGSHTVLDFYPCRDASDDVVHQDNNPVLSLLLERRSLVVVTHEMYHKHLHGIAERTSDTFSNFVNHKLLGNTYTDGEIMERSARLSLTIRHVPKTRKLPGLFGLQ